MATTTEATHLRVEAECLRSLAVMFRQMPGEFARTVGAELAVQAADFDAQARISEVLARTDALSGRGA